MVEGKRILVTGAAGFIGSHLVEELLERGAIVRALVHYNAASSVGNLAYLRTAQQWPLDIVAGNIEDSDFVLRAVEGMDMLAATKLCLTQRNGVLDDQRLAVP